MALKVVTPDTPADPPELPADLVAMMRRLHAAAPVAMVVLYETPANEVHWDMPGPRCAALVRGLVEEMGDHFLAARLSD